MLAYHRVSFPFPSPLPSLLLHSLLGSVCNFFWENAKYWQKYIIFLTLCIYWLHHIKSLMAAKLQVVTPPPVFIVGTHKDAISNLRFAEVKAQVFLYLTICIIFYYSFLLFQLSLFYYCSLCILNSVHLLRSTQWWLRSCTTCATYVVCVTSAISLTYVLLPSSLDLLLPSLPIPLSTILA